MEITREKDKKGNNLLETERLKVGKRVVVSEKMGNINKGSKALIVGIAPRDVLTSYFSKKMEKRVENLKDPKNLVLPLMIAIERVGKSGKNRFELTTVVVPVLRGSIITSLEELEMPNNCIKQAISRCNAQTTKDVFEDEESAVNKDYINLSSEHKEDAVKKIMLNMVLGQKIKQCSRGSHSPKVETNGLNDAEMELLFTMVSASHNICMGSNEYDNLQSRIFPLLNNDSINIYKVIEKVRIVETLYSRYRMQYLAGIMNKLLLANRAVDQFCKDVMRYKKLDKRTQVGKMLAKHTDMYKKHIDKPISDTIVELDRASKGAKLSIKGELVLSEVFKTFY